MVEKNYSHFFSNTKAKAYFEDPKKIELSYLSFETFSSFESVQEMAIF